MATKNTCNGVVSGLMSNISMITYTHSDGFQCFRPTFNAELGSTVESTWEIKCGLCEHEITKVTPPYVAPAAVKPLPTIVRTVKPPAVVPPQLSVQAILAAAERKKLPKPPPPPPRLALPKEDVMPTEEEIARAARPPKLKSDLSTAPALVKEAMKIPFEDRFDCDMDGMSEADLAALRNPEPLHTSGGKPVSPFANEFTAKPSPEDEKKARRGIRPVSVFDI
jgi:hypothetical protein